ncbi:TetR/AcrR family transcriptional regulator [Sporomusa sp.]|jgi:AcrR family transcriptional regulator|uniref:TetR/AcrR family transcriptional regulator n=1 Tax=Sporomusa sp. TaxID=2078658 RepID=UPI002C62DD74|nr:TetR/AcrR family transcriptional regulator [Sporomusa sp.]HWR09664.1 TetR/AcrR family transcriptional regulator [Sporomusa sp.]
MKEKPQDKKAAALQATLELISEQGFHGTPMSQIAHRANIGVGTIYRYFSGKEDLINALYIDVKSRLAQYTLRNYAENRPVDESFLVLLHNIIDFFLENPAELLFIEQYANSPLITTATREEGLRTFAPVNNLFKRASEENLLKELPMEVLSTLAYGATISLVKLCLFGGVKLDEPTLDAGVKAIWDAIKR